MKTTDGVVEENQNSKEINKNFGKENHNIMSNNQEVSKEKVNNTEENQNSQEIYKNVKDENPSENHITSTSSNKEVSEEKINSNEEIQNEKSLVDIFCCKSKKGPPINGKKKRKNFTWNQKLALTMLSTADFMCYCSMSIMAPFYPAEGAKKGMTESTAGLIFGFYALVVFASSPVIGKFLPKFGSKFLFISGLLVSGGANILFGLIDRIEDYNIFVAASFLIRGFEAIGASAYSTAGYVIVIDIFPDNAGAVRGVLETFVGLGLSAGPGIGGILYAVGGFGLPFYVVGIITITTACLNIYLLQPPEKCQNVEKSGSILKMLKIPAVLVTCLIMIVTSVTASFLDPILEPHLRKFSLTPTEVGLVFLIFSATYGIFSPIWGCLTDKFDKYSWMMTTGLFCNAAILLFLGPSPFFPFIQDSVALNTTTLAILGIFVAMCLMPTYQYILDSSMEEGFQDCIGTHSVIAGLWSSVYSLGEVIGPTLGGVVMENYGFPITATTFAFMNLITALIGTLFFRTKSLKSSKLPQNKKINGVENAVFVLDIGGGVNDELVPQFGRYSKNECGDLKIK